MAKKMDNTTGDMLVNRFVIKFGNKLISTNLFKIPHFPILIYKLTKKIELILVYAIHFAFPDLMFNYDKELKAYAIRLRLIFMFGIAFKRKRKPRINPLILEIALKTLILSFVAYQLFL